MPQDELELLRAANTRLRLQLFEAQQHLGQLLELCQQLETGTSQWQQVAIAAIAKADALEQNPR